MAFKTMFQSADFLLGSALRVHCRPFHLTARRSTLYRNANTDLFTKSIAQKDRIAIVDFYADWCGPCRALTPLLEKLTAEPSTTKSGLPFDLLKIDIDAPDGQSLATKYQVTAVPTVYAFLDNAPVGSFQGAVSEPSLKRFLEELK